MFVNEFFLLFVSLKIYTRVIEDRQTAAFTLRGKHHVFLAQLRLQILHDEEFVIEAAPLFPGRVEFEVDKGLLQPACRTLEVEKDITRLCCIYKHILSA